MARDAAARDAAATTQDRRRYEASRKTYPRSGIPEYLRLLVKPLVDAAIAGDRGDAFSHHEPAQAGLTLADINYVAGCYLHPSGCV